MNLFRKIGVTGAALLIALACMMVMGVFILGERRDDREREEQLAKIDAAISQIIATRTESRATACWKDARFATSHNRGFTKDAESDNDFLDFLATAGGTKEPDPRFSDIIAAQKAKNLAELAEVIVDVPDCSTPEAIEAWITGSQEAKP